MNNDKRDEAAEKYWQDHCKDKGLFEHPLVPEVFKAGWDACAAEKDAEIKELQENYDSLGESLEFAEWKKGLDE